MKSAMIKATLAAVLAIGSVSAPVNGQVPPSQPKGPIPTRCVFSVMGKCLQRAPKSWVTKGVYQPTSEDQCENGQGNYQGGGRYLPASNGRGPSCMATLVRGYWR